MRNNLVMDDEYATWTASRLAAAIRADEISSRDLLELYIDRVERLDPPVNAVVTLDLERARADASRADDEADQGRWRGPLHGLPITIKDAIAVGGVRSTGGATELRDHIPTVDAPAVARLKGAGAIVFGKTNAPRWSGDVQTYNEIFGTTNNPWDLERTPGGSSGGAAAAVAAGFTAFELGTDIGGSVRTPSHCCGVFGLKPSYGAVSQRGYLDHVDGGTTDVDINVFGPIARGSDDLELLINVLAGPDADRAVGWNLELPAPRQRDIGDYRVGVWIDEPGTPIDPEVLALLRHAADSISDAGAKVESAHPDVSFAEQRDLFIQMIIAAIAPTLAHNDPNADAASGTHLAFLRAEERREVLRSRWRDWFADYDALLCPVLQVPAFPHDHSGDFMSRTLTIAGKQQPYSLVTDWAGLIGVVRLPSAVAPVGFTSAGLPVGIQVVTPYLRDREAVKLAGLLADACGGGYQIPPGY